MRASWRDEVFGQGGRMGFCYFLAIFPSLMVFFTIAAHIPHLGNYLKNSFRPSVQALGRLYVPRYMTWT